MALDKATIEKLAKHCEDAELNAQEITKITDDYPEMTYEDAYDIQWTARAAKEARGTKIVGMKMGLTSQAKMKKMGGMEGVMSMLPGVSKIKEKMENSSIDENMLKENEAIILSMTREEKNDPKIISGSRRKRISKGSGTDVSKINKLLKQFRMMSDMMKKMSKGKKIPSGIIPDEMINQLK